MPPKDDPRLLVGGIVHCKAHLVTSPQECKRLFGTQWNQIWLPGVVKEIVRGKDGKKTTSKYSVVLFTFPSGKTKLVQKTTRQLFPGEAPSNPDLVVRDNLVARAPFPQVPAPVTLQRKRTPVAEEDSILGAPLDDPVPSLTVLRPRRATTRPATFKDFLSDDESDDESDDDDVNEPPHLVPASLRFARDRSTEDDDGLSIDSEALRLEAIREMEEEERQEEEEAEEPPAVQEVFAQQAAIEEVFGGNCDDETDAIAAHTTKDGTEWFECEEGNWKPSEFDQLNGNVKERDWKMETRDGRCFKAGCDEGENIPIFEYFLACYPMPVLMNILQQTNQQFISMGIPVPLTLGELIRYFGVVILSTRFEFSERRELWSNTPLSKYMPAPAFGKTGLSRDRFDTIHRFIRFSYQPDNRPTSMSHEAYRWMLVDDHVSMINRHRAKFFTPSDRICGDESMVRWYGLGGGWINMGLPMYVAIDRKPENGGEIQDINCGECGIMMQMKIVKTKVEEARLHGTDADDLNHGTSVLKELLHPFRGYRNRIVCADSYFASMQTARALFEMGFRFIGVVKTATKGYPMKYLTRVQMANRGDSYFMITGQSDSHDPVILAAVWMDRERRYFISTCQHMEYVDPQVRIRWRQMEDVETNAEPQRMKITVGQPQITQTYYDVCGAIDQHNRCRQDDLGIERKIGTHEWDKRFNLSVFSIGGCVDTWYLYKGCTNTRLRQRQFYIKLSEALIDNEYLVQNNNRTGGGGARGGARTRGALGAYPQFDNSSAGTAGCGLHLTPSKRKASPKAGSSGKLRKLQKHCVECGKKSIWECSQCSADEMCKHGYSYCSPVTGRMCFKSHMSQFHKV